MLYNRLISRMLCFVAVLSLLGVGCSSGTGTVEGTAAKNAIVTLTTESGEEHQVSTSNQDSSYKFDDVESGDAVVTIELPDEVIAQSINIEKNETTNVNPYGSTQKMKGSLEVAVFELNLDQAKIDSLTDENGNFNINDFYVNTISIENISNRQIGESFYTKEINIPERDFTEGFVGITDQFEWFGVRYTGNIKAPISGEYTFKVTSDDGCRLTIDDEVVIGGDEAEGIHASTDYYGTIELKKGKSYPFLLEYFQGPRMHICLVVEVVIDEGTLKLFDMEEFD